jgi:hypothetical protein
MKSKILYCAMAVSLMFATACSEDEVTREKSPVQNPNSTNVYFTATNPKSLILGIDAVEFTVSVSREISDAAQTVNLEIENTNAEGLFSIPSTVSFSAGEATTLITISVYGLELMKTYHIAIAIEGDQTNPYEQQTVYPKIELNILQEDFAPYANGTYTCDFFEDSWSQVLEYSPSTLTYRLKGLWYSGYDVKFKWTGSTAVTMVGTVNSYGTGIPSGYVHSTYGMVTAYFNGCTYDDATKTFTFPITWRVSAGSFGLYPGAYVITELL